jgi:uncharacterized protein (TIGR02266 family)
MSEGRGAIDREVSIGLRKRQNQNKSSRRIAVRKQRAHPRFAIELKMRLERGSSVFVGRTENISEGGLFVVTDLPEPIGARVDFSLRLPEIDQTIHLSGSVCWIRQVERREWQKRGFGIRFDSIAPETFAQIRQTLTIRGVELRGDDER